MVNREYFPDCGHFVKLDFDPQAGQEQGGWRQALVLTPASYNAKTGMAIVVPITNQIMGYPFEAAIPTDLNVTGVILADAVKNVDWRVRNARFAGVAPLRVVDEVKDGLAALLGIGGRA